MLKFNYALNLGLATLLVVPAVTLGSGGEDSLEATLQRTLKALDQLAAVEQRLQSGDASAIHTVIAATEAPLPTPAEEPGARDALLETLRHDVARLQGETERLENVARIAHRCATFGEQSIRALARRLTRGSRHRHHGDCASQRVIDGEHRATCATGLDDDEDFAQRGDDAVAQREAERVGRRARR